MAMQFKRVVENIAFPKNLKLSVGGYQGSGADIILRLEMEDLLQRFVIIFNNMQCEY
jgi:hypothetical protein